MKTATLPRQSILALCIAFTLGSQLQAQQPDRQGNNRGKPSGEDRPRRDDDRPDEAGNRGNRNSPRGPQGNGGKGGGSKLGNYLEPPAPNQVPQHVFNIVLGRPTDRSITVRVLFHQNAKAHLNYGTMSGQLNMKTNSLACKERETIDFELDSLAHNTRYFYQLAYETDQGSFESDEYTFHTQRDPGSAFVFTVQSDSHLDENTSGEVYLRTLGNALGDNPDFHFELGDTFMTGKYQRPELSEPQYLAQRYYLGHLCHSAPLFFALGNHDGESGGRGDGNGRNSTAWATLTRKKYFPNPFPNHFYTGSDLREPEIGFAENYYQWKWGDAQFIVLDPFRYTVKRGKDGDNWSWTLGDRQYQWLKASLEKVDAKYRFVFLHHLVGGSTANSRGGVEVAPLWEWGGKNELGENEFAKRRPGWEAPIHDLFVKHGVSIVFHGHDHLFIKQDLDGIVYQLVPQPGYARIGNTNSAKEYGYLGGEMQGSSGHIRVRVTDRSVRADYVRSYLPDAETNSRKNADVTYSYEIHP